MDIEPGSPTATSSSPSSAPTPAGNATLASAPPAAAAVDYSDPASWSFELTTAVGLLKRLSDQCGTDAGRQVEELALGQLGGSTGATILPLLATSLQWTRVPQNIGWEGVVLSLLSWAQGNAPDSYQLALATLTGMPPRAGAPTPQTFADYSIGRCLLLSSFSSGAMPAILRQLVDTPQASVGTVVRQTAVGQSGRGVELRPDHEQEHSINWQNVCVAMYEGAGAAVGGVLGAQVGAGGGPAGVTAGEVVGAVLGAAGGNAAGQLFCGIGRRSSGASGGHELAPSASTPPPPVQGTAGDWLIPGGLSRIRLVPPPPGSTPANNGPPWPWPGPPWSWPGSLRPIDPIAVPVPFVPWTRRPTSGPATDPIGIGTGVESSPDGAAMPPGFSTEVLRPGLYLIRY